MENQHSETQPQDSQSGNQMKVLVPLAGVVVIAILGFLVLKTPKSAEVPVANTTGSAQPMASAPAASSATANNMMYKDGTYTQVGSYTSPGGQEELGVTVTIADGVIKDAKVEVKATQPISKMKQEDFQAHFKDVVIGKNISDLQLGKVSGASLTPKGFNDALNKIKAAAQS